MVFAWGFTWVPWFFMLRASLSHAPPWWCHSSLPWPPGAGSGRRLLARRTPEERLGRLDRRGSMCCCRETRAKVTDSAAFQPRSGFVLTHARMRSNNPTQRQGVKVFVQKRLAVIYPMYALSLLLALLVQWWRGRSLPSWWAVLSQGVLAQSWLPWLPEQALQPHCWAKPQP